MAYLSKKQKRKYEKVKNKLSYEIINKTISEHIKVFKCNNNFNPIDISLETLLIPSRKKTTFKKPPNPFIIYRKYLRYNILNQNKNASINQISKTSSQMWNKASPEIKCYFHELSNVVASAYAELNSYTNDKVYYKSSQIKTYTFPIKLNSSSDFDSDGLLNSEIIPSNSISNSNQSDLEITYSLP